MSERAAIVAIKGGMIEAEDVLVHGGGGVACKNSMMGNSGWSYTMRGRIVQTLDAG